MRSPWIKRGVFAASLLPLLWLAGRFAMDDLGVNPVETINRFTGDWALRFLLLSLAITPLRRFGQSWAAPLRRMLGLYAFFYLSCHLLAYLGVDLQGDWQALWRDIQKRTYITLGMAAFVLMLPLAVTSTNRMIRRLGGKNWQRLHRLTYPIASLAVAHYWMMVKADIRQPVLYAMILSILLAVRLIPKPRRDGA